MIDSLSDAKLEGFDIHRYRLVARDSGKIRLGALFRLRVLVSESKGRTFGHSDLFSWPELGDPELESLIELARSEIEVGGNFRVMARGIRTPILRRAVDAATDEIAAILEKRPLIRGSIRNHALALSAQSLAPGDVIQARRDSFPAIKVKIGRDGSGGSDPRTAEGLLNEGDTLARLNSHWGINLRLDAGGKGTRDSLLRFLDRLPVRMREQIEFMEDPMPYDPRRWLDFQNESGVALAFDRPGAGSGADTQVSEVFSEGAAKVFVFKPAVQSEDVALKLRALGVPIVVTSMLGHPVGNLWAASVAARIAPEAVHGCFSHTVYRDDEASSTLKMAKMIRGASIFGNAEGLGLQGKWFSKIKWETLC